MNGLKDVTTILRDLIHLNTLVHETALDQEVHVGQQADTVKEAGVGESYSADWITYSLCKVVKGAHILIVLVKHVIEGHLIFFVSESTDRLKRSILINLFIFLSGLILVVPIFIIFIYKKVPLKYYRLRHFDDMFTLSINIKEEI